MKRKLYIIALLTAAAVAFGIAAQARPLNPDAGGSHAGKFNSFSRIHALASDATGFKVVDLKKVNVPTSYQMVGQECGGMEEQSVLCRHAVYGDYVPAYRLTVEYVSDKTHMVSEYPSSNVWTESFNLHPEELNADLVNKVSSGSKAQRKATLQSLVREYRHTTVSRQVLVVTKACEKVQVGEMDVRQADPNCVEETGYETVNDPAIEVVPAN